MAQKKPEDALFNELQAERAATLGRIAGKMEAALDAWRAAPTEENRAIAAERVWWFVVQRESLGWRDHKAALEAYDVPASLILRMGPRRSVQ